VTARRSLARAGLIVTAAFFVSRLLGWIRVVVIGTTFGASGELDSFFAAFRIPDLIFQLVAAGALASALIPVLGGLLATDQEQRAWRVASTVTNLMMLALFVLAVVVAIAAPVLIPLITPGFDVVQTARTIELTRIMLLSPILLALGSVATSILNAQDRFTAAAMAPIVYNVAIIAAAIVLAPTLGVEGLAIGVVIGSLLHLLVQLRSLFAGGFRYEPIIERRDPAAREALILMAPRAIGLGVTQLTFVVSTTLASGLATGSITAFNIAFTILQIPIGVIGVPLGVVVFPSMARELARGAVSEYMVLLTRSLRLLLFVMLPLTGLGMVLRQPIVGLLFDYGKFGQGAVDLTASTLLYFLTGLAGHALIAVLARAFYAGRDTATPVVAAILAVVVNVGLGIILVGPLGLSGLALAIAAGAWLEATVLLVILRDRYPSLDMASIGRAFVESGVGAVAASVAALGTMHVLEGPLGTEPGKLGLLAMLVVAGTAGGLVYLGVSVALRIPELPTIVAVMTDLLRRPRRP
jgi:putative peptidoglycan lipid II flippase